jgi:hypothetical protein
MDGQLGVLLALTFLINLIGSLAYSVRIAGVRTGRIALSFSLFNILVLVSRTANTFQTPLLAKRVEHQLGIARVGSVSDFRWLLAAASFATLIGALLTPTFQRVLTTAVASFARHRSIPHLVLRALSPAGLAHLRDSIAMPAATNVVVRRRSRDAGKPLRRDGARTTPSSAGGTSGGCSEQRRRPRVKSARKSVRPEQTLVIVGAYFAGAEPSPMISPLARTWPFMAASIAS